MRGMRANRWMNDALPRRSSDGSAILSLPPPPADVRIAYGAGPSNFGDLRMPQAAGPAPVVAFIHGGFWRARYDLEHAGHLCAALTANGIATWNIEYRRLAEPGGGWPGTFLDVARGVNHLREVASQYDLALPRLVVMGHSAGGHLALWAAALTRVPHDSAIYFRGSLPIRAAISLAGVSDLRRAFELELSGRVVQELLGVPEEYPERYAAASPIELLPLGVRQFVLHGTEDQEVPFEISQRYYDTARARGDDVDLLAFPRTGHYELIDPRSKAWPRVVDVVRQGLG